MTKYHEINLPKMTLFLTSAELCIMLQKDMELFKRGLERGKAFKRHEGKQAQYEKKFANQESQMLNNFMR